jgi:hypothetical protein
VFGGLPTLVTDGFSEAEVSQRRIVFDVVGFGHGLVVDFDQMNAVLVRVIVDGL